MRILMDVSCESFSWFSNYPDAFANITRFPYQGSPNCPAGTKSKPALSQPEVENTPNDFRAYGFGPVAKI